MKESIHSIIQWHEQTFPDATMETQSQKFNDELDELNAAIKTGVIKDIMAELADCAIVACGLCRYGFAGCAAFNSVFTMIAMMQNHIENPLRLLLNAIDEKMAINRQRKWLNDNGKYQHIEENGGK